MVDIFDHDVMKALCQALQDWADSNEFTGMEGCAVTATYVGRVVGGHAESLDDLENGLKHICTLLIRAAKTAYDIKHAH